MVGIGVIRVDIENLTIDRFRGGGLSRLVQPRSFLNQFRKVTHLSAS
jgi:hypothetical protein